MFLSKWSKKFFPETWIHTLEAKAEKVDNNFDSTDSGGSSSSAVPFLIFSFKFIYLNFKSPRTDSSADPISFLVEWLDKFLLKS